MTLGGAAQVAVTHCPNERTLDPAVCSYNQPTYAPVSRTMAGWGIGAMFRNVRRQRLAIFSNDYYQIRIATHLPTPKGWKAELA